jgi:hypothetical protein
LQLGVRDQYRCFQTPGNALMVVLIDLEKDLIDLEKDDDPQVIFETLNARGSRFSPLTS